MIHKFKVRWCSIITVLSPILMMYFIGISTVTLLDFSILLTYGFLLITGSRKIAILKHDKFKWALLTLILYVFTGFIINMTVRDFSVMNVFLRTLRYLVYLSWPIVLCHRCFDKSFAIIWYEKICLFATFYLILQYVFLWTSGYSLPGYLPFLTLSRPELQEFTEKLRMGIYARPRSIFAEPSQFGIYVTGYVSIMLLEKKGKFNRFVYIFLLFGLLLSSSTTAYFGVVLSVAIIFYNLMRANKNSLTVNTIILFWGQMTAAAVILVSQWEKLMGIVNKAFIRMPTSFRNRLVGYSLLKDFFYKESLFSKLFGIGMDVNVLNEITWTSSVVKIIYYYGTIGVVILLSVFFYMFCVIESENKILLLIIITLGFFTEVLISNWLVLFLPFIYPYANSIAEKRRRKESYMINAFTQAEIKK